MPIEVWDRSLGEVSGQPCAPWLPRPSPQVEIHIAFNGCWVKALSCTPEAVGHWQWSFVALIHHSGFQSGLLRRDVSTRSATWQKGGEAWKTAAAVLWHRRYSCSLTSYIVHNIEKVMHVSHVHFNPPEIYLGIWTSKASWCPSHYHPLGQSPKHIKKRKSILSLLVPNALKNSHNTFSMCLHCI